MLNENQHIEFKPGFNEDVIETLTAFANTQGGKVLVGVNDDGKPVKNFTIGRESIQNWINEIKTKTQPSIIPDAEIVAYKDSEIVEFAVQEFPVKPVACRGKYFKRVKNSNHQLSVSEISDIYLQSMQYSWDAYPAMNATVEDIDPDKVQKFIDKVNSAGRFSLDGNPFVCLKKLKFISDNTVTNAALLLFSKEEIAYNVHIGRLKTPTLIIDDRIIKKTLFETVEEIMQYIISQIKVAFEIKGYPTQRTEIFEYPVKAIRETVLNAIIHRDYLLSYDIQIRIFDKELTVYNPGRLSGNLTFDDLKRNDYQAYARNRLIAEAFYLTGDIEKYGSGFRRIRENIETYPTMKTDFREIPNGLLFSYSYDIQKNSTTPPYYTQEMVDEKQTQVFSEISNKTDLKTDLKTDNVDRKIMELISNNPFISIPEIAVQITRGITAAKARIAKLQSNGMIERVGPDKGGYWKVIEKYAKKTDFHNRIF
jgi:ATP-dependent DNA helicase RecG